MLLLGIDIGTSSVKVSVSGGKQEYLENIINRFI